MVCYFSILALLDVYKVNETTLEFQTNENNKQMHARGICVIVIEDHILIIQTRVFFKEGKEDPIHERDDNIVMFEYLPDTKQLVSKVRKPFSYRNLVVTVIVRYSISNITIKKMKKFIFIDTTWYDTLEE